MMLLAIDRSLRASCLRLLAALLILTGAGLATPAHALDLPSGPSTPVTEAASDGGQSDLCLCEAFLICTSTGLGLLSTSEIVYLTPRGSFRWLARIDAQGRIPSVPLPPPKNG